MLDALTQVELFVDVFVGVYTLAILAYILRPGCSCRIRCGRCSAFSPTSAIRICASGGGSSRCRAGPIDFSPMVAVIALVAFDRIFDRSARAAALRRGGDDGYTPVELRHVKIGRSLFGYAAATRTSLLEDVADSFEEVWCERGELADKLEDVDEALAEFKEREALLATTLVVGREGGVRGEGARAERRSR